MTVQLINATLPQDITERFDELPVLSAADHFKRTDIYFFSACCVGTITTIAKYHRYIMALPKLFNEYQLIFRRSSVVNALGIQVMEFAVESCCYGFVSTTF